MNKLTKVILCFGIVLVLLLSITGCSKEEAFQEEDFQEVEDNSEKQQLETKNTNNTDVDNGKEETKATEDLKEDKAVEEQSQSEQVCVYVCGAVNNPGVYSLENGKRIGDAIAMAGGMKEDAAHDSLNQAELLTDAQMIRVLTVEEVQNGKTNVTNENSEKVAEDNGLVNINSATCDQLMALPGIGQNKADSIIAYREENGKFNSVEDIMNIAGIKEGVFNKIKDYITVD